MITIIDYGMGNTASIKNMISKAGGKAQISADPEKIMQAKAIILPGVGHFGRAMELIHEGGFRAIIDEKVKEKVPVLGICLGMQLLADSGTEDGNSRGLGWIAGNVLRLDATGGRKIPHIGFNAVSIRNENGGLLDGLDASIDFYFVHSYHFVPHDAATVIGVCEYGAEIVAAVRKGNIWGVQFHPEKSQSNGLCLFRNFSNIPPAVDV